MSSQISSPTITCKAAVVFKSGELPKLVDIQVEQPKSTEIRIKMVYASLCHTDIVCRFGLPVPLFPRVLGHEGVGVVESIGESVTNLKEGDIVMPLYLGECGECLNCKSGRSNLCHKYPISLNGLLLDGTSRMSINGELLYQTCSSSTWSEYVVLDANYAVKVDPRLSLPHASFLSCGFTTGFGSTWKEVNVEKGSSVVVLGLGAVGLGAIAGARMQGASKIIGIDLNELKREKGEAFGMTDFINPKNYPEKSISELIKEATGGLGVDYCFECTGVPALLNEALEGTKVGLGTVVLIGVGTSGELNYLPLLSGRTIKGTMFGGVRPQSDLPTIIEKCTHNKEIELDELLTHEVSFNEIEKAFECIERPDCLKVLIKF